MLDFVVREVLWIFIDLLENLISDGGSQIFGLKSLILDLLVGFIA